MSAFPGKIRVLGVTNVHGKPVFILEFIQARKPGLVRIPFFANYDPNVSWYDQLRPAFSSDRPFFEEQPRVVLRDLVSLTA